MQTCVKGYNSNRRDTEKYENAKKLLGQKVDEALQSLPPALRNANTIVELLKETGDKIIETSKTTEQKIHEKVSCNSEIECYC